MREIVLDTETTGLDPAQGHKIIEIGCVELMNHVPTGRTFWHYIYPEREIEAEATAIHGITNEMVRGKPVFGEIAGEFLDFIKDAKLVIHNAEFDIKFLNHELKPYGFPPIKSSDAIDTVLMARKKFPGSPANLDALCRRFGVDLSGREYHGALLDSQLLAQVYLELLGGRQHGLGLGAEAAPAIKTGDDAADTQPSLAQKPLRPARPHAPSAEEEQAHAAMLASLKNNLWAA